MESSLHNRRLPPRVLRTLVVVCALVFANLSFAAHGAEHLADGDTVAHDCTWCEHLDRSDDAASPIVLELTPLPGAALRCQATAGPQTAPAPARPRARSPPRPLPRLG